MMECRVCGKLYKGCRTPSHANVFRWQDVACCPEHGSIYFERILESRKVKDVEHMEDVTDAPSAEPDLFSGSLEVEELSDDIEDDESCDDNFGDD